MTSSLPQSSSAPRAAFSVFRPEVAALLLALACLTPGAASGAAAASDAPARTAYPASAWPDRIVLSWTGDPATSAAVTWRTEAAVTGACAQLVPATDGPVTASGASLPATTQRQPAAESTSALAHTVEFTGLEPGTVYAYRVGDGARWSEWFQFRTARRDTAPFAFLFLGDPQVDLRRNWSRLWRQAWLAAPHAAFAVCTGDLINHGEKDVEWGEWFEALGWLGSTRPLLLATGSHEYHNAAAAAAGNKEKSLSTHWRPQFSLPANGPAGLEETCYYIDYQGARLVILNTQEKREEQAAWLRQLLAKDRPRWLILAFHEPIFSGGRNRDNAKLRSLWKPVIDELQVDLVLTGHDHVYGRSGLDNVPTGYKAEREAVNGTIYVLANSGPKMYELTEAKWAQRSSAGLQTYQIITIDGDELRYVAETATGRRFDAFTLQKAAGARNRLLETMPAAKH